MFNVSVYSDVLPDPDSTFETLLSLFPQHLHRRTKLTYGDDGLVYTINFRGNIARYNVLPWTKTLLQAREHVRRLCPGDYNTCVVQMYPSGKIGINPHRDKEMVQGTTIAGLSLGATRTFLLTRKDELHIIPLPHNSLYILHPPTNDHYLHSIPVEDEEHPRISLTFRTYRAQ